MNCLGCNNKINPPDLLRCVACKGSYHYLCLNFSASFYKTNAKELRRTWRCDACTNVTRRTRNDDTPIGSPYRLPGATAVAAAVSSAPPAAPLQINMSCDESLINNSALSLESVNERDNINTEATITMQQFSRLIDTKLDSIRATLTLEIQEKIKTEMKYVTETLTRDFTETTDFLSSEQSDIKCELKLARETVAKLEAANQKLQSDIENIELRLQQTEKLSRSCNLEIQCIPERRNENLANLVKKLCGIINVPITDREIRSCRRVAKLNPSSNRPRNVLVTLPSERYRDEIISGVRRYNKSNPKDLLSSTHIGVTGERSFLYVGEHLSKMCKDLHAATRKLAKDKGFKYVWIKYGRVYVRKDETSPAIHVKNMAVLEKSITV